ncbi:MAG: polysaccharide deacetylase family protein, partial [Bacteroidetes bacterium]|nr:polysaccharide deacetylase family protein [Bacteroidota bacterium]
MENKIMISVDMDEWFQGRWATGSKFSLWKDTKTFFQDVYKSDKPIGEIIPLTEFILQIFKENNIIGTFFFTGEIARYYPDLVKMVAFNGHEIASHNDVHIDYNSTNKRLFEENLKKSKYTLEDIIGKEVIGYRAPNSTVANYMIEILLKYNFKYDSSITPTRPFMGKFGKFTKAPINPYILCKESPSNKIGRA